jgi:iron(III) transport system substrate-binding protein
MRGLSVSIYRLLRRTAVLALVVTASAACAANQRPSQSGTTTAETHPASTTLTVYSGRNEQLVGPLLEQLKQATGAQQVDIRYGDSAELAAQLLEEGERTEADLFFSQDAGALGALAGAGRLTALPTQTLDAVPAEYRAKDGTWVATSARARVVAYDPKQVPASALPANVDALVDPRWRGKIGFAPTNASWQSFVTALRVIKGESGARDWLTKFKANEPVRFDGNALILDAVDSGQLALGLINHYYWFQKAAKVGADKMNAQLHYVSGNDPAALVNVAGVGVLKDNNAGAAATKAVEFLLSPTGQQYFAEKTAEYPVVAGTPSGPHNLKPLSELKGPDIDLSQLSSLSQTLELLKEVGLS